VVIYDTRNPLLRIGSFSAFYGDRPDAMALHLDDGCDVLVGDYLAELTMLILRKNELRGRPGYAPSFVSQLAANLDRVAETGVRIITNAGGLDPEGCAQAVRALCAERGLDIVVAAVVGDNLREELEGPLGQELELTNMDTGEVLDISDIEVLTANAYLGAWPIVEALDAGAQIVICPRMTDASVLVGPAAWHFGWGREDWDQLAGAVVAGHLVECGGQVTGGNYARFFEHPSLGIAGLPVAEIDKDGATVISKLSNSGGLVTVDTVKAQLFYEIGGTEYLNPDVITDIASVELTDLGDNRVRVSGVRGRTPTPSTKLSLTYEGGYRNTMTIGITGLHVAEKFAWLQEQIETLVGSPDSFDGYRWTLVGPSRPSDGDYGESTALAVLHIRDRDPKKVSRRAFSDKVVQLALASIPGFYLTTPPGDARLFGVQWPCLIEKSRITTAVRIHGRDDVVVPWGPVAPMTPTAPAGGEGAATTLDAPTVDLPLGALALARSGDKGGSANIGVWARTAEGYSWLREYLTEARLAELMPEARGLRVVRHDFPNLQGLNFVLYGYLEEGVSSCTRIDPQAKGLAEYLLSKTVPLPVGLAPAGNG